LWAVVEDVAQMSTAFTAHDFGSGHAVGGVLGGFDGIRAGHVPECRPATAGVVFGVGFE